MRSQRKSKVRPLNVRVVYREAVKTSSPGLTPRQPWVKRNQISQPCQGCGS